MRIYGKNVVKEYLEKNNKINKIYLYKDFNDQNIISLIRKREISPIYLSKNEIDKLEKGNHQGIIIDIPDYEYVPLKSLFKEDAFLVILDHIEDPHNLGAIIRTCEAASVDGIIIPKNRSVGVNSTVAKVSVGTINNIQISEVVNLNNTIKELKKNGFWIIGTDMKGSSYNDIDYKGKIALVIGNEGKGMSNIVKSNCDYIATIPMKGEVNSLNASVAAGIMIFKALEKR